MRLHARCRGTARTIARLLRSARDESHSQASKQRTIVPCLAVLRIPRTVAEEAARAECRGDQSCPREKDVACHADRDTVKQRRRWRGGWLSKEAGTTLGIEETPTVKEWSWSTGRRWPRISWARSGLERGSCWDLVPGAGVWWGKWWGKKKHWGQWGGW